MGDGMEQFTGEPQETVNGGTPNAAEQTPSESARAFIQEYLSEIEKDKVYHAKAFKRMREDQDFADGKQWPDQAPDDDRYVVNFTQSVIRQRVSSLYAKNPKVQAKRRERLDFAIWDGKQQSLQEAMANPMMPANFALLQDVQQGRAYRERFDRIAKTLEIAFNHDMKKQYPNFKRQMKQFIRRVETNGAAFLKLDFERMMEVRPDIEAKLNELKNQLSNLEFLLTQQAYEGAEQDSAESEKIKNTMAALEGQKMKIVREGIIYSFPRTTAIIIDRDCTQLEGFINAKRVVEEFWLCDDEVQRIYKVDCSKIKGSAGTDKKPAGSIDTSQKVEDKDKRRADKRQVFECYDMLQGVTFTIMVGYDDYLVAPQPPKILLDRFFPYFPFTLNERENEQELYPPSTPRLIRHVQMERNRSKEALRQHRIAKAPKYAGIASKLASDQDKEKLGKMPAHSIIWFDSLQPGEKISEVFHEIETSNIDPNVYEVGSMTEDISMCIGLQDANMGAISRGTATEVTVAEDSRVSSMSSATDDLDDFLSEVVGEAGQVMLMEYSPETIKKICGPGAAWSEFMAAEDIINDIYLDIVAGSSGKPNKANKVSALERLYPVLVQVPGFKPEWLARQLVELLDDGIDLTDAWTDGLPSINALNAMMQEAQRAALAPQPAGPAGAGGAPTNPRGAQGAAPTGNPQTDPRAQGGNGAMKTPAAAAPQNMNTIARPL